MLGLASKLLRRQMQAHYKAQEGRRTQQMFQMPLPKLQEGLRLYPGAQFTHQKQTQRRQQAGPRSCSRKPLLNIETVDSITAGRHCKPRTRYLTAPRLRRSTGNDNPGKQATTTTSLSSTLAFIQHSTQFGVTALPHHFLLIFSILTDIHFRFC